MNKISDNEKIELSQIIDDAGLFRLHSADEFGAYLDRCMDGYRNNPLFSYFCKGNFNSAIVRQIFYSSYCASMGNSVSYCDSEEKNSCAVWIPSGIVQTNFKEFFKSGGAALLKMGGPSLIMRIIRYELTVKGLKDAHTNHNDWYLYNYECAPEFDNDETFIKMVKPVVDNAWKTGRACYIEVSVESRIPALMKMGFHIVGTVQIPNTSIKLYGMIV